MQADLYAKRKEMKMDKNITTLKVPTDLEALSNSTGKSVEELYNMSLSDILALKEEMNANIQKTQTYSKLSDQNYRQLVIKYLEPYHLLSKYWTDDEIIQACAICNINIGELTEEYYSSVQNCPYPVNDYITYDYRTVRRFTKSGEELLYGERKKVNVFRIRHHCQHIYYSKVIKHLLLSTYPQLKDCNFSIYGLQYGEKEDSYEIYPKNPSCIYTPFKALMEKDIDTIIKRNIDYAKAYNFGEYTPEKARQRLASKEVQAYFKLIKSLPEKRNL